MLHNVFVILRRELSKPALSLHDNSIILKVKKDAPSGCGKSTISKKVIGNNVSMPSQGKSPFILPDLILKWIKVGIMFITFLFYLTLFVRFLMA